MEQRTDIHRPAVIVPEDYQFVAFEHIKIEGFGDVDAVLRNREVIREHMARTGGFYSQHEHGGNCHICGAVAIYTVLFYHAKTNTYIRTGEDCASKLDMAHSDMNPFRRAIQDAREAHAGKRKAIAILDEKGLSRAWDIYLEAFPKHTAECLAAGVDAHGDDNGSHHDRACTCDHTVRAQAWDRYEERTIRDIVTKLVHYGSVSDKATEFLRALLVKIDNRPIIAAQRAAEAEAAAPAPSGRVVITGRVLSMQTRERESFYYGDSGVDTKVLIQALTGFKVWGNRFANVEKGDLVTFTATLKVSEKDPKFAFFSRATKGFLVNPETGEILVPQEPSLAAIAVIQSPAVL